MAKVNLGVSGFLFLYLTQAYHSKVGLLLSLITKQPPPSRLGVRLAATGLSVLISCNSLLALQHHETKAAAWVSWLVTWSEAPR